jgi:hypothetical protein
MSIKITTKYGHSIVLADEENMTPGGAKLNYVIPKMLDDALTSYCDQTGRSASDVIRQLLAEFIDGDRKLSTAAREIPNGVRSNMILPGRMLDALDAKLAAEGHGTRGAVIARLLYDFLEHRMGDLFAEAVTLTVERDLYNKLYDRAQRAGKTVEDLVLDACRAFV